MCGTRRMSRAWSGKQDAPLTHPEAAGGWGVREGGRVGSTKAVLGRGGEVSSKRSKNAFVFDFLFAFGRLVGDTG
jgi:hypothetical protein